MMKQASIRYMAAGHVYSDSTGLHRERLREKLAVTRARGARFSSVRFVTGKLDLLGTRAEFLDLARRSKIPMLMIYGAQTPSRSGKEMEGFATVRGGCKAYVCRRVSFQSTRSFTTMSPLQ